MDEQKQHQLLRERRRDIAREKKRERQQRQLVAQRTQAARRQAVTATDVLSHNAIVLGLVPRISASIDAWVGKRIPLTVNHPTHSFSAETDFESININIPELDEVTDFAGDLRGLAYHEAGHILLSVPFLDLMDAVMPIDHYRNDGSTRKARHDFVARVFEGIDKAHRSWNLLEDQRMETAMVALSPNLARYYNVIVLTHLVARLDESSYVLLAGRAHVDADIRDAARAMFVHAYGDDMCTAVETVISAYKAATEPQDMWNQVARLALLLRQLSNVSGLDSVDRHAVQKPHEAGSGQNPTDKIERSATPEDTEEGDEEGMSAGAGEGEEEGEEAGEGETGEPTADDNIGTDNSGQPDKGLTRQDVKDALDAARKDRNTDSQIARDIKAYNEAMESVRGGTPLRRLSPGADSDPAAAVQANKINRAYLRILAAARARKTPSWQRGQREGVIDVMRYATRQPGDMDIFRSFTSGGEVGLPDLSVSLILDGSSSMDDHSQGLAIAAYAMKSACTAFEVPCTVVVYDSFMGKSRAQLLWDHDERPVEVPKNVIPGGSTDPKAALDLIDTQMHDRKNHLVIIMTDGAWDGEWNRQYSLAEYGAHNRDLILFYYGHDGWRGKINGEEVCALRQPISDLMEMPKYLNRYLVKSL